MTGFGESQLQNKKIQISIQIKSLNGRFLETKFRLPRVYSSFEAQMRTLISDKIQRGSLEIFINRTGSEESAQHQVIFKTQLAKNWLKASQKLAKDLKIKYSPHLGDVLKIPDIYEIAEANVTTHHEQEVVLEVLSQALKNCVDAKNKEGEKLVKNLLKLLSDVEGFLSKLIKKKPQIDEKLKAQYEKKIQELAKNADLDKQRLHQESVYMLERADIEEEITRLGSHIDAFKKTLNEKGSIGKKLDFLVQEMHREVNTMGSKTQALEIMESIIDAKAFVEKIREQVQNIE